MSMQSMEFSDRLDDAILHLSSMPLRERNGSNTSTTPSSAFSGTDGAPSSRASLEGHWIDLVDQRLEHGRGEEAEGERTGSTVEMVWENAILEGGVEYDAKVQSRSTQGVSAHHIPIEKAGVTSGHEVRTIHLVHTYS
jgi:hypothetical protein